MYKVFIAASLMALAACDPVALKTQSDRVEQPEISCATQPGCSFSAAPLRVLPEPVELPRRPYKFFPIAEDLTFRDSRGRVWTAPRRTLTDGASIPRLFVSVVGDPTSPEFINAAAVHDAYCGVGNEDGPNFQRAYWEDVHIMFYDGLIEGGADPIVAKVMFAAVWLGGPRWNEPVGDDRITISTRSRILRPPRQFGRPARDLSHLADQELIRMMRKDKLMVVWLFDESESMKDDQQEIIFCSYSIYKK